ncbi:proton channel OTOP2-like [Alosa sapidissima]|uniref:proton channel OTOP2-like n=1 Tax=Alosa sapidissima TaxID=34773 RepID=UPI001C08B2BC|nr:proton channel OTOP2-like [Alosa sapidissima]
MQSGTGHSEKALGSAEMDASWEPTDGPQPGSDLGHAPHPDPLLIWAPTGQRLLSGLLGLNLVLFGAALVVGNAFHPQGLRHQEPLLYLLVLMVLSMAWMLCYLFWGRRLPGASPHKDHHAGGITVTVVLMTFSGFSLLLHVFKMGYNIMMIDCKPATNVIFPFIEAPFLGLQAYLIWAHSKDCIHKHKILTRCGLIILLAADLLLWLNSVSDDTVHQEIEMEKEEAEGNTTEIDSPEDKLIYAFNNSTQCQCRLHPPCLMFRKGIEVLFPFNIEFYLMAGCMIYVMWKNVGRGIDPAAHSHQTQKFTLRVVYTGGIFLGLLLGLLVLVVGLTIFVLYQVWVSQEERQLTAFLLFYGYHLVVMPLMSLCSLAGVLVHKLDRRAHEDGHNPTRSLDVMLLVVTALGQLALSYFSLVAALADGVGDPPLGALDLSYSLLSLLELVLQNVFIIEGLHRHPSLRKGRARGRSLIFKKRKTSQEVTVVDGPVAHSLVDEGKAAPAPPSGEESNSNHNITRRVIQEICSFLILANIMLWVIPAFGAHPQFKNNVGKEFYGFTAWFILVNMGQPLCVFYRMHSVGALMELLILA